MIDTSLYTESFGRSRMVGDVVIFPFRSADPSLWEEGAAPTLYKSSEFPVNQGPLHFREYFSYYLPVDFAGETDPNEPIAIPVAKHIYLTFDTPQKMGFVFIED